MSERIKKYLKYEKKEEAIFQVRWPIKIAKKKRKKILWSRQSYRKMESKVIWINAEEAKRQTIAKALLLVVEIDWE